MFISALTKICECSRTPGLPKWRCPYPHKGTIRAKKSWKKRAPCTLTSCDNMCDDHSGKKTRLKERVRRNIGYRDEILY